MKLLSPKVVRVRGTAPSFVPGPFQVDFDKPVVLKEGAFGDPLALKAYGLDHVLVGRLVSECHVNIDGFTAL